MRIRQILYAENGKMLTNGTIFCKVICLAENAKTSDFWEITEEEYTSETIALEVKV